MTCPRRLGGLGALLFTLACGHGPRSPQALMRAYDQALRDDDPHRAYALLSPDLRARTSEAAFVERWKKNRPELLAEREAQAREQPPTFGLARAVTHHPGGARVEWVEVDGRFLATSGLPGAPRMDTPQAAIRALVAHLRSLAPQQAGPAAAPELRARLARDWELRARAIERALKDLANLQVSGDGLRAELRYGDSGSIRLEQRPEGWRVVAFE